MYPDTLVDFANLTLSSFRRRSWVDISLGLQQYIFADRLVQGKRMTEKGGKDVTWKVQVANTGTARNTDLYAVDNVTVRDLTTSATVNWSKQTVNWSYDDAEDAFQSDDMVTIVKEIEVREHAMYNDFFDLMETNLWGAPTSTTQSPRPPSGVPFWLQKYTAATPSFQGGNPSGFTAGAGGIDVATYNGWYNWAGAYVDTTRADLVKKVREATTKTYFMAPKSFNELSTGKGRNSWEHLTTYRTLGTLEQMLEDRNENLGPDLGKYMGSVVFQGNPVTWVPYLETNDTSDPWYGICWDQFYYFVKSGRDMILHPLQQRVGIQHTVYVRHMDHYCNFGVYNRRMSGFVLSK